jgi:hypothetical protein
VATAVKLVFSESPDLLFAAGNPQAAEISLILESAVMIATVQDAAERKGIHSY